MFGVDFDARDPRPLSVLVDIDFPHGDAIRQADDEEPTHLFGQGNAEGMLSEPLAYFARHLSAALDACRSCTLPLSREGGRGGWGVRALIDPAIPPRATQQYPCSRGCEYMAAAR